MARLTRVSAEKTSLLAEGSFYFLTRLYFSGPKIHCITNQNETIVMVGED